MHMENRGESFWSASDWDHIDFILSDILDMGYHMGHTVFKEILKRFMVLDLKTMHLRSHQGRPEMVSEANGSASLWSVIFECI